MLTNAGKPARVVLLARPEQEWVVALTEGAAAWGIRAEAHRPVPTYGPADVVRDAALLVTFGWQPSHAHVVALYRERGVPVYALELPRLRYGRCGADGQDYGELWGLYENGPWDLPRRVGNVTHAMGVLRAWKPRYVLVCGQKPNDAQHGLDEVGCTAWAEDVAKLAAVQFELPVSWRPHPRGRTVAAPTGASFVSDPDVETLREALAGAAVVVTYNSGAGLEAIDAGVPAQYTAPPERVFWRDYATPFGAPPRVLTAGERRAALLRAGASQWTSEQLRDGTAIGCLLGLRPWPAAELVEAEPHPLPIGSVLAATPARPRHAGRRRASPTARA